MPVSELKSRLDLEDLPDAEKGRYNTLAGLLMAVSGHLPKVNDRIDCVGWHFDVVSLDGRRIAKVVAKPAALVPPHSPALLLPSARSGVLQKSA
jgi:putative hemolysin